jgi:hypothetical protein
MKSALSLTLIVCLVGWTLPVSAQEAFRETTQGPMTRATVSEAVRLALTQQNRPTAPSPKAGGPFSESASREAAKPAAVASSRQKHASKRMVWTGVAVAGTGVALAAIAVHKANVSYCPGSTVRGCDENVNGGLLAAGTVAILAGSILTVVGALPIHADLTAGAGAVMITRRVTF